MSGDFDMIAVHGLGVAGVYAGPFLYDQDGHLEYLVAIGFVDGDGEQYGPFLLPLDKIEATIAGLLQAANDTLRLTQNGPVEP